MSNSKRPTLDIGSLGNAAGQTENPVDKLAVQRSGKAKTRIGKRVIQGYFDPQYRIQMKMLAARCDKSVEALLQEAMDDLFSKHHVDVMQS